MNKLNEQAAAELAAAAAALADASMKLDALAWMAFPDNPEFAALDNAHKACMVLETTIHDIQNPEAAAAYKDIILIVPARKIMSCPRCGAHLKAELEETPAKAPVVASQEPRPISRPMNGDERVQS